ncbi:hypothetical protein JHK85_024822 [Glycine max]|nr:hypothetical protein JHK85_024822 [Glycine max]KAG5012074.1 hypothetical protein JHK86_024335 [Glycine max]
MDELGSALRHSDEPNFRVAPFLFMPKGNLSSAVRMFRKVIGAHAIFFLVLGRINNVLPGLQPGSTLQRIIHAYEKHHQKLLSPSLIPPTIQSSETRTKEPKDADIVWTSVQVDEDMKKAVGITEQQYINQFPFEASLVMKHHLAETIQKAHGSPQWLQPTYNLETHLSQLIGDYCTGPKICQKYIEQPALFQGRKFDLRYIVLARIANNQYSLDRSSLFEYETHFTVMNYRGTINHKNANDFVREFEEEHQVKWLDIHTRVRKMIRSVFEAAAGTHPEMQSPTSRAMYGVDVMLDSSFQPKLLEVTYCPDCTRACKYDMDIVVGEGGVAKASDFFNNVSLFE